MDRVIREAVGIVLHPNSMSREDVLCLSKSWKLPICSVTDRRKPLSRDSRSGFSAGPHRSVHTAVSGHSLVSTLMSHFLPLPLFLHPPRMPTTLLHIGSLSNTPLHLFHVFFPRPAKPPMLRAILNICFLSLIGSLGGRVRAKRFHSLPGRASGN
jgi:hypothetical protein